MTINVDEIVVGCGASALAHLYYAIKSSFTPNPKGVAVIGRDDLWKKVAKVDPEHRFGQPKQIVEVRGNQPTVDIDPGKPTGFQTAKQVDEQLDLMRAFLQEHGVTFYEDDVTRVCESGEDIQVYTRKSGDFIAKRVIVATGFGRSAVPRESCPEEILNLLKQEGRFDTQASSNGTSNCIIGGAEYLYATNLPMPPKHRSFRVAVQGSSATSSWAVLRALSLAGRNWSRIKIYWITRSSFKDANPAGRNSDILKQASDNGWLVKAELAGLDVRDNVRTHRLCVKLKPVGQERTPPKAKGTLSEHYQDWYKNDYGSKREAIVSGSDSGWTVKEVKEEIELHVDHFVYATGADPSLPGGAGQILSEGIKGSMQPVFDKQRRFDDDPEATVLGFCTKNEKVWVVGAAAFRGLGLKQFADIGKRFAHIAEMMCEGGSPPEGIAAIISGAKALTGHDENNSVRRLSLQTADFKEIENWFGILYLAKTNRQASEKMRRTMADQIVALRKHTVFGLSKEEIDQLGNPNGDFWNEMFTDYNGVLRIDQVLLA